MRPVTVHVGLPKTGSTALQFNLFVRHPQLAYVGRPLTRFSKPQAALFAAILERSPSAWDAGLDTLRTEVEALLAARPGEAVLLSHEELSAPAFGGRATRPQVARRLRQLLPTANIVLVVRSQLTALPSVYHQLQRVGLVADEGFEDWTRRVLADEALSGLYDVDAATADFEAVFGADRVHVLTQEALRHDAGAFVDHLCRILGVDPDVGREVWVDEERNARAASTPLDPGLQALVAGRFGPGNRALQARRALALDRFAYPLGGDR